MGNFARSLTETTPWFKDQTLSQCCAPGTRPRLSMVSGHAQPRARPADRIVRPESPAFRKHGFVPCPLLRRPSIRLQAASPNARKRKGRSASPSGLCGCGAGAATRPLDWSSGPWLPASKGSNPAPATVRAATEGHVAVQMERATRSSQAALVVAGAARQRAPPQAAWLPANRSSNPAPATGGPRRKARWPYSGKGHPVFPGGPCGCGGRI